MRLSRLSRDLREDYRSGPYVFTPDAIERAQSYRGPLDYEPHIDSAVGYKPLLKTKARGKTTVIPPEGAKDQRPYDPQSDILNSVGFDENINELELTPAKYSCPACGGHNATLKLAHEDTDIEELEYRCPDCECEDEAVDPVKADGLQFDAELPCNQNVILDTDKKEFYLIKLGLRKALDGWYDNWPKNITLLSHRCPLHKKTMTAKEVVDMFLPFDDGNMYPESYCRPNYKFGGYILPDSTSQMGFQIISETL